MMDYHAFVKHHIPHFIHGCRIVLHIKTIVPTKFWWGSSVSASAVRYAPHRRQPCVTEQTLNWQCTRSRRMETQFLPSVRMDDDADGGGISLWVNSMQSNAKNMFNVLLSAKQYTFSIECRSKNTNNEEKMNKKLWFECANQNEHRKIETKFHPFFRSASGTAIAGAPIYGWFKRLVCCCWRRFQHEVHRKLS